MINKAKIKELFKKSLTSGSSPNQLALSFALGIYIAFSPFPGAHTIMMFIARLLFNINFPLLFLVTSINNPWTMIPFFLGDYAFGYWFVHSLVGLDPSWTLPLAKIFGSGSICIWSFLIGGNILGVGAALISYPIMHMIFKKIASRTTNNENNTQAKP